VIWTAYKYLEFPGYQLVSTIFAKLHIWAGLAAVNIVRKFPAFPAFSVTGLA
jgi:hypothetical protein